MYVRMGGWIDRQLESLWCRLRVSQPQRCCRLAWAALMWGILGTTGCGAAALVSTHHVPGAPLPHSLSHINQKCLPKLPRVPWGQNPPWLRPVARDSYIWGSKTGQQGKVHFLVAEMNFKNSKRVTFVLSPGLSIFLFPSFPSAADTF